MQCTHECADSDQWITLIWKITLNHVDYRASSEAHSFSLISKPIYGRLCSKVIRFEVITLRGNINFDISGGNEWFESVLTAELCVTAVC